MKKIWNSFLLAFSMYSISPKTKVERSRENTRYILVFIPLVGVVIGFCISQWAVAYPYLCNYAILPAVVGAVIPSMISAANKPCPKEQSCQTKNFCSANVFAIRLHFLSIIITYSKRQIKCFSNIYHPIFYKKQMAFFVDSCYNMGKWNSL